LFLLFFIPWNDHLPGLWNLFKNAIFLNQSTKPGENASNPMTGRNHWGRILVRQNVTRADKGAKHDLWEQRYQRGCRQDGSRAGLLGQPPNQGKMNRDGTDQREDLSGPDGEEFGPPAFKSWGGRGGSSSRVFHAMSSPKSGFAQGFFHPIDQYLSPTKL